MSDEFGFDWGANQQPQGRDICRPMFFWQEKRDGPASTREGRPIFKKVPMVRILIPGDSKTQPVLPVSDEHKRRWPTQWANFEKGSEAELHGTPLKNWPALDVAQVAELNALAIFTVEELAALSDAGIERLGAGGRNLVRQAEAYIKAAADDGVVYEAMQKAEQLEGQNKELAAKVRELEAALREKQTVPDDPAPVKRRGRPRKSPE